MSGIRVFCGVLSGSAASCIGFRYLVSRLRLKLRCRPDWLLNRQFYIWTLEGTLPPHPRREKDTLEGPKEDISASREHMPGLEMHEREC